MTLPHRCQGYATRGGAASLLVIILLVLQARPLAGAPRLQVVVHQGRLSVDLWEADLGAVLAKIRQQAGIFIRVSPSPEQTVSVQFADVALDHGLRHILQLASRGYAMRYAPRPTGEVTLQEVQVFAEAPAGDQSPVGAAHAGEEPGGEVGQHFVDTLLQRQAAAPAVGREDERHTASHFRHALERHSPLAPGGTDVPENDAAYRFRNALEEVTGATWR